ncbi:hypothetical protein ACFSO7_20710 [Bacillus sp. CGMCC 1.16607]|uniref:hypothetical protein n=1 Tax=Bacillus sp. CGMCC 1.16607 TaxID=3351842 RepID=UPI0036317698
MYKVINTFRENQHGGHIYNVGDEYPAKGQKLVKSRAEFLTKPHITYGVAFLEEVEEKKDPASKKPPVKNDNEKQVVNEKSDE